MTRSLILDEAIKRDLTYSVMLNIVLFSIALEDQKPDPNLIGKINRARNLRNAFMRKGVIPNDQREISDIYSATKAYIDYIRQLRQSLMTDRLNNRNT